MKKTLISCLLTLVLLSGAGYAADNDIQKIKGLEAKLVSVKDAEKAKIYNQIAKFYADNNKDIEKIKIYAEKAIASAKKHKQLDQQAYGLRNLGRYYGRSKQIEKMETIYFEARKYAEKSGDRRVVYDVLETLSALYAFTRAIDNKLNMYKQMLEISTSLKDVKLMAKNTHYLASGYLQKGWTKMAFETYNKAIELYKACNDWRHVVQLMSYTGSFNSRFGNQEKAIKILEEALQIGKKNRFMGECTRVLVSLGQMFLTQRNYEKSENAYKEAIVFAKGLNWHSILAFSGITIMYIYKGDIVKAQSALNNLKALNKQNKTISRSHYDWLARFYEVELLRLRKNFNEAEERYMEMLVGLSHTTSKMRIHRSLSKVYLATNKKNKALNQLELALENARNAKLNLHEKRILKEIIHIYQQKQDLKNAEKYKKLLKGDSK